jgi:copper(I)-binding protein
MHIMLMQLRQPLEEGESIPITFIFEEAGEITVSAAIARLAARTPPELTWGKPRLAKDKHTPSEAD